MHATGTLRDHTGPGEGEQQEEQKDFSVPPALATAESRPRAHTASRRDHVTDTEHDFPVWGDGQAGLTPPTSNVVRISIVNAHSCAEPPIKLLVWCGKPARLVLVFCII